MPTRKNFPGRKQLRQEQALSRHKGVSTQEVLMNGEKPVFMSNKKALRT